MILVSSILIVVVESKLNCCLSVKKEVKIACLALVSVKKRKTLATVRGFFFSRGHATLHLAASVGTSVRPYVGHIFEFRAVVALQLLPNRPRLDCRVSGLV